MLSRQQSSLSSSRRQATTTPPPESHHVKSMGCMSGIFQLFSKYQNSNKRLTFGRKQEKCKPLSPEKARSEVNNLNSKKRLILLSCDVAIRTEAAGFRRRSKSSPDLIKRLMGLEDVKRPSSSSSSSSAEIGEEAVQKCKNLEELKRIILAVNSSDVDVQSSGCCTDVQELSPVSVLGDEFMTQSQSRISKLLLQSSSSSIIQGSLHVPLQPRHPTLAKKSIKDDEPIAKCLFLIRMKRQVAVASPLWRSKAMLQSVEEVCSDIVCGEKREIRRIGLVLQDNLCKDLIEELVQEFMKSFCINYSLALQGCKKRLCF